MSNEVFKCQHCKKTYDVPKSLPCGNTICSRCLSVSDDDPRVYRCPFCTNEHPVPPENGFPVNIILNQLMNSTAATGSDETTVLFEKQFNEIALNLKALEEKSTRFTGRFDQIRGEIVARSEFLVKNIYDIAETMISDLEIYENELTRRIEEVDEYKEKIDDLREEYSSDGANGDLVIEQVKFMKEKINAEIEYVSGLKLFDPARFQYESATGDVDSSIICKLRLHDILKFEKMGHKISNFKAVCYKPADSQLLYDYNYFVSSLEHQRIVVGLNVKQKSAAAKAEGNVSSYKLKILVFNSDGQLENELPLDHEINQTFKQLEHFVAHRGLIYCVYIDNEMQYCLKIFDPFFQTVKDLKFNSIIKSIAISDTDKIYTLFNILTVNVYDLHFEKLNTFGQLIDENAPFYMESTKEMFIRNAKIYLCHKNERKIRVLDEETGGLIKTVDFNFENCLVQMNRMSKIACVNRLKKSLALYDDNGRLVCENEILNIQNVSSISISSDESYVINDHPNRMVYLF